MLKNLTVLGFTLAFAALLASALVPSAPAGADPLPASMLLELHAIANGAPMAVDEAVHRTRCALEPSALADKTPDVTPMSGAACTAQCRADYEACLDDCDAAPFPGCYDHCRFDVLYPCYRKCFGS